MKDGELEAGPELDAIIAEKVMGWEPGKIENGLALWWETDQGTKYPHDAPFSTDISSAWEVVEFLRKEGFDFDSFSSSTRIQAGWSDVVFMSQLDEFSARAETLPLAVCRAALLAVKGNR
jgi:hypothetical protein